MWSDAGYMVDVDYQILDQPIIIIKVWRNMESDRPQKYSYFQENRKGNQA